MGTLISLELRKNNIKTFLKASLIIFAIMLMFMYLFVWIPKLAESEMDQDLTMFHSYNGLIVLTGILNMACFSVLSAVMYSKFIIEEYQGKKAILLFSYPIDRIKIFQSKLVLVSVFTLSVALFSNLLLFAVLVMSETLYPVVNDVITIRIIWKVLNVSVIMAVLAAGFGTISLFVGFLKNSVQAAVVTSVILCSLVSNVAAGNLKNDIPILLVTVFVASMAFVLSSITAAQISKIEV